MPTVPRILPDLSSRYRQPEVMDSPGLEAFRHTRALLALARINVLSLAARRTWAMVRRLPLPDRRVLRVLDVACGGGDVAIALKSWAEREGVPLEVWGCDLSPTAVDFARGRAEERGVNAEFFQHDATTGELPSGFDLVCSSLFLHHLSEEEVKGFLERLAKAGRVILVQDLLRTRLGYLMAEATVRVVTRSRVVRVDGPQSVRAAFTLAEARNLARDAGLTGARVAKCWPERFSLHWEAV